VLLIDGHSLVNSAMASLLEKTGRFRVLGQARTLAEGKRFIEKAAQAAAQTAAQMPDLIMLDIQLGEENGLDFLPFLKGFCRENRLKKPPVLVCSAFNDAIRIQAALKLGASGYHPKTGNRDGLLSAIDAVLRGETSFPGERGADPGKCAQLTKQELKIIHMVKLGKSNPQIAEAMHISKRTVETHIRNIFGKTGADTREELIRL